MNEQDKPHLASTATAPAPAPGAIPATSTIGKAPYRTWTPEPVPPVSDVALPAVVQGLAAIVAAEGPLHAGRAYQLYVQASGGHRVGREIRRILDGAVDEAVRQGAVDRVQDAYTRTSEATLFLPGAPSVQVRERGPRSLSEIPRGEVRAVLDRLDPGMSPAQLKRAVLHEWGFGRLTGPAELYLDECLRYAAR
ncbi:hypothetical protein JL107_08640 [Nakamurella flavida]|uniref:Uncharacterized protein n=1 Tax=Nakamurella flavida TaxID=363630 RepID=A0A939C2Y2_9ACTN|nr:hypothetical protein [Nakamurella flavida]MBM9476506.1 hypothetical protein [Nakamurella flavida]MDP9779056.1 hypothetical protein [Nakamurella flavida]